MLILSSSNFRSFLPRTALEILIYSHHKYSQWSFRAAHDGEYRKLKHETKKLLEIVGSVKRTAAHHKQKYLVDITKMSEEIAQLRESNKNLTDKKLRKCTCSSVVKTSVNSTLKSCATIISSVSSDQHKLDPTMANHAKAEIKRLVSETCRYVAGWFDVCEEKKKCSIRSVNWRNKETEIQSDS